MESEQVSSKCKGNSTTQRTCRSVNISVQIRLKFLHVLAPVRGGRWFAMGSRGGYECTQTTTLDAIPSTENGRHSGTEQERPPKNRAGEELLVAHEPGSQRLALCSALTAHYTG